MNKQAVSYIRVSTARQGSSGLGLEAQRESVRVFAQAHGYEVAQEFLEVESGKNDARPVLQKALAFAKKTGACLVIAKLDRLARSVSFVARLMDANTDFKAIDLPDASRLVLHIMSAVAENEAKSCSDRTKAALAAAKARGVVLGASNPACRNSTQAGRAKGRETAKTKARAAYADLLPQILALKAQGLSFQGIADALNDEGQVTRNGKEWRAMQILRTLKRAVANEAA
jgi:DNA invertase Pin-like site-specific DNA recombinase